MGVHAQWYLEMLIHAWQHYEQPGHDPDLVQERGVKMDIKQAWVRFERQKHLVRAEALFNPETSILIQKCHPYNGNLNSETSGDSTSAFLHCGDVVDAVQT